MSKVISFLGVLTAVAFAIAPQVDAVSPRVAPWLMLLGTVAAAISGALLKFGHTHPSVTFVGVGVAVASVLAGAADVLPVSVVSVAGIVGTALAAMGRSLFPVFQSDIDEEEAE